MPLMINVVIYEDEGCLETVTFPGLPQLPVYSLYVKHHDQAICPYRRLASDQEIEEAVAVVLQVTQGPDSDPCCYGTGVTVINGQPEACACVETWEVA